MHMFVYVLFVVFFMVFSYFQSVRKVCTPNIESLLCNNGTNLTPTTCKLSPLSTGLISCGVVVLVLASLLLGYEGFQWYKFPQYFKRIENRWEIGLYLVTMCSVTFVLTSLVNYDTTVINALLLVGLVLLGAWNVGKFESGLKVFILMNVLQQIQYLAPVIVLFLITFTCAFCIVLPDNDVFVNYQSLVKVLAMTIGEIDFSAITEIITCASNRYDTMAMFGVYMLLALFMVIMPIVVMNWLLAIIVIDVPEIIEKQKIVYFETITRLTFEYYYIIRRVVKYKHEKTLKMFIARKPSSFRDICGNVLSLIFCFPCSFIVYFTGEQDCDDWFMNGAVPDDSYKKRKAEYIRKLTIEHEKYWKGKDINQRIETKIDNEITGLKTKISNMEDSLSKIIHLLESQPVRN